jgi:hypothetical protein
MNRYGSSSRRGSGRRSSARARGSSSRGRRGYGGRRGGAAINYTFTLKMLVAVILIAGVLFGMVSCVQNVLNNSSILNAGSGKSIAIVMGNVQGNKQLNEVPDEIIKAVIENIESSLNENNGDGSTKLKLISTCGKHNEADLSVKYKMPPGETNHDEKIKKSVSEQLNSGFDNFHPESDNSDFYESIKRVKSYDMIYVFGSGVNDAGYLDFTKDNFTDNLNKSVDDVAAKTDKIEIQGSIKWFGIGESAGSQVLKSDDKDKISKLYSQIITPGPNFIKAGSFLSDEPETKGYKVQTVEFKSKVPCWNPVNLEFKESESTSVKFIKNESTYIDRGAAEREITSKLSGVPADQPLVVEGWCASSACTSASTIDEERANVVVGYLKDKLGFTNVKSEGHSGEQPDKSGTGDDSWRKVVIKSTSQQKAGCDNG